MLLNFWHKSLALVEDYLTNEIPPSLIKEWYNENFDLNKCFEYLSIHLYSDIISPIETSVCLTKKLT